MTIVLHWVWTSYSKQIKWIFLWKQMLAESSEWTVYIKGKFLFHSKFLKHIFNNNTSAFQFLQASCIHLPPCVYLTSTYKCCSLQYIVDFRLRRYIYIGTCSELWYSVMEIRYHSMKEWVCKHKLFHTYYMAFGLLLIRNVKTDQLLPCIWHY